MTLNRNQHLAVTIFLAGGFAILTALVLKGETYPFDLALRKLVVSYNSPVRIVFWEAISFLGSVRFLIVLTCLAVGLFAIRRDWLAARQIAIAMIGAVALNCALKWMVHRVRPDEIYANTMPESFSYPSGHALHSLTFYMTIAMLAGRSIHGSQAKSLWIAAVLTIVLIGTSRIFLGVHYGSDVLGGYLIAAVWLLCLTVPTAPDLWRHRHNSLL